MNSTRTGKNEESAAAEYLRQQGYIVKDQNWRTRWCEIDIVAEKAGTVFFVEVKYREFTDHGSGLDYITPKKLQQMRFAAELLIATQKWGGSSELAAIEVTGNELKITAFIDGYL